MVTTDLTASVADLIARYAMRWSIEVRFFDCRQILGAEQARNRVPLAVELTFTFGMYVYSLVVLWYATWGHRTQVVTERRINAPWYQVPPRLSGGGAAQEHRPRPRRTRARRRDPGDAAERIEQVVAERAPQAFGAWDPYHLVAWGSEAPDKVRRQVCNAERGGTGGHTAASVMLKGARGHCGRTRTGYADRSSRP